jgi:hypothetical protein
VRRVAGEGPQDNTRWRYGTTRCLGDGSRSEVAGVKGTDGSRLEAVGTEPARTPRRRGSLHAARGAAKPVERPARRRRSRARL